MVEDWTVKNKPSPTTENDGSRERFAWVVEGVNFEERLQGVVTGGCDCGRVSLREGAVAGGCRCGGVSLPEELKVDVVAGGARGGCKG